MKSPCSCNQMSNGCTKAQQNAFRDNAQKTSELSPLLHHSTHKHEVAPTKHSTCKSYTCSRTPPLNLSSTACLTGTSTCFSRSLCHSTGSRHPSIENLRCSRSYSAPSQASAHMPLIGSCIQALTIDHMVALPIALVIASLTFTALSMCDHANPFVHSCVMCCPASKGALPDS